MMAELDSLAYALGLVFVLIIGAMFSIRFPWMRFVGATVLYLCLVHEVMFGIGGFRGHLQEAREQGKSADHIAGLGQMYSNFHVPRRQIFVFATGLYVLAIAGFVASAAQRKANP